MKYCNHSILGRVEVCLKEIVSLQETYGQYAELLHRIDSMALCPDDLRSQRDFMDFACRSFASRLERRRNVLITAQRFFRLVDEVSLLIVIHELVIYSSP